MKYVTIFSYLVQRVLQSTATPLLTNHNEISCLEEYDPDTRTLVPIKDLFTDKCLIYTTPSKYISTLKQQLVGLPEDGRCDLSLASCGKPWLPYVKELREIGNDWPPLGYTMVGMQRLENFRAAIEDVNRNNVKGDIVELGVWRGGAMIYAAAIIKESNMNSRFLHLYDVFGYLPDGEYGWNKEYLAVELEQVKKNFQHFDLYDKSKIHFIKGLFRDTASLWNKSQQIAVLRVDGNFYDSYQDAMYALYSSVPVGGIVIFDDVYSHESVMTFWTDFRQDHGLVEEIVRIDRHSGWFRKMKSVYIDQRKKRSKEMQGVANRKHFPSVTSNYVNSQFNAPSSSQNLLENYLSESRKKVSSAANDLISQEKQENEISSESKKEVASTIAQSTSQENQTKNNSPDKYIQYSGGPPKRTFYDVGRDHTNEYANTENRMVPYLRHKISYERMRDARINQR